MSVLQPSYPQLIAKKKNTIKITLHNPWQTEMVKIADEIEAIDTVLEVLDPINDHKNHGINFFDD